MTDARNPILQDDYAQRIRDSDELHNINCYEYLLNLFNTLSEQSTPRFEALERFYSAFNEHKTYDQKYPYGNLYAAFRNDFENEIHLALANLNREKSNSDTKQNFNSMLRDASGLISAIYLNNNRSLERTSLMIQSVTDKIQHTSSKSNKAIQARLRSSSATDINATNPYRTGSLFGIAQAYTGALSGNYKPQATSLPAIRTYAYKTAGAYPTELRFGTQGQYVSSVARVSPLFHAWLLVQQEQNPVNSPSSSAASAATAAASSSSSSSSASSSVRVVPPESLSNLHVYINNLRLDSVGGVDSIQDIEIRLSKALHELEKYHPNIAVITLPSDKGLMSKTMLHAHEDKYSYREAFNKMLRVATGKSDEKIQDFFISDKVKKLLYGTTDDGNYNIERESDDMKGLLTNSFVKLGFDRHSILSPAQFHAVYFHFIKFELTSYILNSLTPHSFNMTCKDAIDRGGVSSAYYNLITSIETSNPMTQEEFIRALHAAPAMVKGRAMNHHIVALWNAVDSYIDAHPAIAENPALTWLIEWRDNNAPENSKRDLQHIIHRYIVQRNSEEENVTSISGIPGSVKLRAANTIEALSRGVKFKNFTFETDEWQAINEGRLGRIVTKMVEHGLIDLRPYAPKEPNPELFPGLRS